MARLQLRVRSARNLNNGKTIYLFVQVVSGLYKEKTERRKCPPNTKDVYWTAQFVVTDVIPEGSIRLELKNKESIFASPVLIGVSNLQLPSAGNDVIDSWVPILDPNTKQPTGAELHLIYQLENDTGSMLTSSYRPQQHQQQHRTLTGRSSTGSQNLSQSPSGSSRSSLPASHRQSVEDEEVDDLRATRPTSGFDGHAAALTINELLDALERVKKLIESATSSGVSAVVVQDDPERLRHLRQARTQLRDIMEQIKQEESVTAEWKEKLVDLADRYEADIAVLLSSEAWEDVNRRKSKKLSQCDKVPSQQDDVEDDEEEVKQFSLDSLEAFDQLIDSGYATQVSEAGTGPAARIGDEVHAATKNYIWDSASFLAVRYGEGPLNFVLGAEDQPKGLSLAMEGMNEGSKFTVCLAPEMAYGEDGTSDVPPDTHVLFEVNLSKVNINNDDVVEKKEESVFTKEQMRKPGQRASLRFPARQAKVALAQQEKKPTVVAEDVSVAGETPPPLPPRSQYTKKQPPPPTSRESSVPALVPPRPRKSISPPPPPPPPSQEPSSSAFASVSEAVESAQQRKKPNVDEWLEVAGFGQFAKQLHELGIEELADCEHLRQSDLDDIGMRRIQVRKFAAKLEEDGITTNFS